MTRETFAGPSPFFLICLLAFATSCSDPEICDSVSLVRELSSARRGANVRIGNCRIEGANVDVPEGVTLGGSGSESALIGAGDAPVVTLGDGATLVDIAIETRGSVGVRSAAEDVTVQNVRILLERGIGIGVEGAGSRLIGITIVGPDDADTFPPFAEPNEGAYGVVMLNATDASIVDLRMEKVGPWGGIVAGTTLTWDGGALIDVTGTGLYVDGGSVALNDVSFDGFAQGLQPLPAYGMVFTNNAMATTTNVEVANADLAALHDASPGTHTDLDVHDNRYGGLWIQRSDDVMVAGGTFTTNGVTAVASVLSSNITLDGTNLASSVEQTTIFGEIAAVQAGDGIQLLEPTGPNTLREVTLESHPRIGLLVDLASSGVLSDIALNNVSVQGDDLGCLAQEAAGLIPLGGWDDSVTRLGETATNDAAQIDPLAIGGSLSDGNLPSIDTGALGL